MELSGMHFVYSGVSSRLYNLIFTNVTTDRTQILRGNIETTTIYNKAAKRNYYIGESYEDAAIEFDAEITTESGEVIPNHIQRTVERWLFRQTGYQKLYIDIGDATYGDSYDLVNGEYRQLYLNCKFNNPEKIEGNGGIVGYKFTVECDSSMAWQDSVTYEYDLGHIDESSNSVITVSPDSDLNDYIYPTVTITMGSVGGDVYITNNTDDSSRLTSFVGLTPYATIIMKGDGINYISGDNYTKFYNRNFIRLVDGNNDLTIIGNIEVISFEFQNRRYI